MVAWNIIIISSGQTGAERAALDFAIKHDIPHGGWSPKGRTDLDGPVDARYKLKETPAEQNPHRSEWNVRDSDATVVFTLSEKATGSSMKPIRLAKDLKKPFLHLHPGILAASEKLIAFTEKHSVRRLHVAGANESNEADLHAWVDKVLEKMLKTLEGRENEARVRGMR